MHPVDHNEWLGDQPHLQCIDSLTCTLYTSLSQLYTPSNASGSFFLYVWESENYSTGDKVPSVLYKLGLSLLELKSVVEANEYFEELINKYPHTQEAKLAKEKLKETKS